MATYVEAQAAKQKLAERFKFDLRVNGVGLAAQRGKFCVRVNLTSADDDHSDIPDELDGVKITTKIIGNVKLQ